MTPTMSPIVTALISAIFGGVVVALINHYLNREKSKAEIEKIRAETEKIQIEVRNLSATVSYAIADADEKIIFDGRRSIDGFAVRGNAGQFWSGGKEPKATSERGEGTVKFEANGILNVQRTNRVGRYELYIQQYAYGGKQYPFIPKDELIAGKRKLRISCEAKVVGGEHSLRFVVRNRHTGQRFAEEIQKITVNDWTPVQVYLQANATEDSEVRIDDEQVSAVPSSVQIRNLLIAERAS
jgi:hypothetical protein